MLLRQPLVLLVALVLTRGAAVGEFHKEAVVLVRVVPPDRKLVHVLEADAYVVARVLPAFSQRVGAVPAGNDVHVPPRRRDAARYSKELVHAKRRQVVK